MNFFNVVHRHKFFHLVHMCIFPEISEDHFLSYRVHVMSNVLGKELVALLKETENIRETQSTVRSTL